MAASEPQAVVLPTHLTPGFFQALGVFHGNWAAVDVATDYAICQFMKIPPEETHLLTAGRMFGQKAVLLIQLIKKSDHPNKQRLLKSFNWIRGNANRDVIAHSYIMSSLTEVTFLHRMSAGDGFRASEHDYTMADFVAHCIRLSEESLAFANALELDQQKLQDFVYAAFNLNRKTAKAAGSI